MIAMGSKQLFSSKVEGNNKQILLIEDNEDDVELTKESLSLTKVNAELQTVSDLIAAKKFLAKALVESSLPDMILLDLNLNGNNGMAILSHIKKDVRLKHIPVIVLTTSQRPQDVLEAYSQGASCFIRKPLQFQNFLELVQKLCYFWLVDCELPQTE